MPEFVELLVTFAVMAGGALTGSLLMWVLVGPAVITRSAPKAVRKVITNIFKLTEEEIAEEKGDVFKAITKKQASTFAQSMYGALGNIVQGAPTEELEAMAKKYGFGSVEDAKEKLLGDKNAMIPPGIVEGLAGVAGGNSKNAFSSVIELITAMNAMGAMGGIGGALGGGGQDGGGQLALPSGGSRVSGW